MKYVVGIDEVGRGPLAGPVTVCIVMCEENTYKILKRNKNLPLAGKDSKKLREKDREKYEKVLKILAKEKKIFFSVNHVSNKIIDKKGISFCIKHAILLGFKKLKVDPANARVLLDGGLRAPAEFTFQKTIIKGDEKEQIIAWSSILAKVSRDDLMRKIGLKYLGYSFGIHKGYGTKTHRTAIQTLGLSDFHRKSFCTKYT
jgi:ribonuclease HII